MLNFPEEKHSRAPALPASAFICTVGMYQQPLSIPFLLCGNGIWLKWLNGFHSEIWLRLIPTRRREEELLWLSCSPFVLQREKRKYSLSEKVEGIIVFFRYLQKQVVKFKVDLWLLSALKQITSSNLYHLERVLASPALPIFSGQHENNSPWLFLRVGITLLTLHEFEKQSKHFLYSAHALINKDLAVLRST